MAAIWDTEMQRFVVSTTTVGTSGNLNVRGYGAVYLHAAFDIEVTNLTPNTPYKIYLRKVQTNASNLGGNSGWNTCCEEEDLDPTSLFPINSELAAVSFTTDDEGEAFLNLTPTINARTWDWGIVQYQGLNFYDGQSPSNSDQLSYAIYNIGIKTAVDPGGSKAIAIWESIHRYNPYIGYQPFSGRYFTFFDRSTEYEFQVYYGGSLVTGSKTTVIVETPFAFQVGAGDYPQNSDTDYTDPQMTVPLSISNVEQTQYWSPITCIGGDESEYSEDIIQRFVTNPTNQNLYLEALEIYHEGVDETYYLVNDRKSWDFTLEDDSIETHQPYGFAITLPTTDQGGVSEMSITVDNTDRFLSQFIADAKAYDTPVKCTYRVYAADDPTTPQLTPPLKYDLTDVTMNGFQISGKTRKIDVVNANFLTENYTRKRFPSLGS